MGRQRNNSKSKENEESPERLLNEIEATKPSDIKFKIMVVRTHKELNDNFKELQRTFKELTVNYTSIKDYIETIKRDRRK